MYIVAIALVFAGFVLGMLVKTRRHHRSADQEILLQKTHQN